MSLLIFSDTINPGTYGYSPSVAGQLYLSLNNLSTQPATVSISVINNGVSTIIDNVTINANSSYESSQFSVLDTSIISIQSNIQLNFNLYSYYAAYEESPYDVDYTYTDVLSGQTSSSITNSSQTVSVILANLQIQLENINNEYLLLLNQYGTLSTTVNTADANITSLTTDFNSVSSDFINISNQVNRIAITQNQAIIQGSNNVFQYVSSQTTPTDETVSGTITLQGPTSGSAEYVIVKNSIYQKLFFSFNNYLNNSEVPMTVNFPYSYIYPPYINNSISGTFTYNENSISFNGSSDDINGSVVIEGLINTELNGSNYYQINGQSSGTISAYYAVNGGITKYILLFNQYENTTSGNQEITLPVAFSNTPLLSNTTGLSITVNTNNIIIISPNSTNLFNGMVLLEGI